MSDQLVVGTTTSEELAQITNEQRANKKTATTFTENELVGGDTNNDIKGLGVLVSEIPKLDGVFGNKEMPEFDISTGKFRTAGVTAEELSLINAGIEYPGISWTDNLNGTITVNQAICSLFDNENGTGFLKKYTIPQATLSLTDNSDNFIYADQATQTYIATTNKNLINSSNRIPAITVFRNGNDLHPTGWDSLGTNVIGKFLESASRLFRYYWYEGLAVSTNISGNIFWTQGVVYKALLVPVSIPAFDSTIDDNEFYYKSAGLWTSTSQTAYPNTQYQGATDLQTLDNNKWGTVFYYTGVEGNPHGYFVLGTSQYDNESNAKQATPPTDLPEIINTHCILNCRIVFQKGIFATQANIASYFSVLPSSGTVTNHNGLAGLELAGTGVVWGHINNLAQTIYGEKTFNSTPISGSFNAISSFLLNGIDINTGGTLSNVFYLDKDNTVNSPNQVVKGTTGFWGSTKADDTVQSFIGHFANGGAMQLTDSSNSLNVSILSYGNSYFKAGNFAFGHDTATNRVHVLDTAGEPLRIESASTVKTAMFIENTSTGAKTWNIATIGSGLPTRTGNLQFRNETDGINALEVTLTGELGIKKQTGISYDLELANDSAGKPTTNTWTITSDERIKENITEANIDRCYEIVKSLPLKHYGWKYYDEETAPDQTMLGWIAQDVQSIFPKAVAVKKFIIKQEERELVEPAQEAIEPVYDIAGNLLNEPQEAKEAVYKVVSEEEAIEDCLDLNADQINKALYGAVQKLIEKVELLENEINILKGN